MRPVVPLVFDQEQFNPSDTIEAWHSQRARLRDWLQGLPDDEWSAPTRCADWNVSQLVRHLLSVSQFLGYTLHKAADGVATDVLENFDPQKTAGQAAARLGDLSPEQLREGLETADRSVDDQLEVLEPATWSALAEAPPGHLPAHLVVAHMLFDSWVHEFDLMIPQGRTPEIVTLESRIVVAYVTGLAAHRAMRAVEMTICVTEPEFRLTIVTDHCGTTVTNRRTDHEVQGRAQDIVDRTTGRLADKPVVGDAPAIEVLDSFGAIMRG